MNTQFEFELGMGCVVEEPEIEQNWKPHPRFTHYEVSDMGNVRDIYTRKPATTFKKDKHIENTYIKASIYDKSFYKNYGKIVIHKLVAETWLGEEYDKNKEIHHINSIKADNRLCNLLQLSKQEHKLLHSIEFGQFTKDGILIVKFKGSKQIKELNLIPSGIYQAASGRNKTYKKHIFRNLKNFPSISDWIVGEKYEIVINKPREEDN